MRFGPLAAIRKTAVCWVPPLGNLGKGASWTSGWEKFRKVQPQKPWSCHGGTWSCCVWAVLSAPVLRRGWRLLAEADLPPL